MQAAIKTGAQRAERMVTTLPSNGNMAALARWKSSRQQAKIISGRFCIRSPGLVRGLSVRRFGMAPCARSGSISAGAMLRSASSAGTSKRTVTMKTARGEK